MSVVTAGTMRKITDEEKRLLEGENKLFTWRGYHNDIGLTPHPYLSALGVRQLALGGGHWLVLTQEGRVWGQGRNDRSQLGLGHSLPCPQAQLLKALEGETVVQVACGVQHSGAVTERGHVYCWGDNSHSQCGLQEEADQVTSPARVSMVERGRKCEHGVDLGEREVSVVQLSLGAGHSAALSDTGQLWIWGSGVALGSAEVTAIPRTVESFHERNVLSVSCGHNHVLALVEKPPNSRTATPERRRSLRAHSVDKQSRYNPTRCAKCKVELYTCIETSDTCIIEGDHVCSPAAGEEEEAAGETTLPYPRCASPNSSVEGNDVTALEDDGCRPAAPGAARARRNAGKSRSGGRVSGSGESCHSSPSAADGTTAEVTSLGTAEAEVAGAGVSEVEASVSNISAVTGDGSDQEDETQLTSNVKSSSENIPYSGSLSQGSRKKDVGPADASGGTGLGEKVLERKAHEAGGGPQACAVSRDTSAKLVTSSVSNTEKAEEREDEEEGQEKEVIWRRISEEEREREREEERERGGEEETSEVRSEKSEVPSPSASSSPSLQKSTSLLDEEAAREYLARQFDEEDENASAAVDQEGTELPPIPESTSSSLPSMEADPASPSPPMDLTSPPPLPPSSYYSTPSSYYSTPPPHSSTASPPPTPPPPATTTTSPSHWKAARPPQTQQPSPSKTPPAGAGAGGSEESKSSPLGFVLPYSAAMMQTVKQANRALANMGASVADRLSYVTTQVLSSSAATTGATTATTTVSNAAGGGGGGSGGGGTDSTTSSVTSLESSSVQAVSPFVSKETSPSSPLAPPGPLTSSPGNSRPDPLRRQSCPPQYDVPDLSRGQQLQAPLGVGLETEVWVWGHNNKGQLGVGDSLDRSTPTCLKMMSSKHVVKLAAGSAHSLALTANSHVYTWGNNAHGQLGHNESQATPNRLKFMKSCSVWDVAAGEHHSLFLADSSGMEPDVFFCGRHPLDGVYAPVHKTKIPTALSVVKKEGWLRSVMAGGDECACLLEGKVTPMMSAVFQFAASERSFYQHLNRVITAFLSPLKKSSFYTTVDVFPYSRCLKGVVTGFSVLTRKVGQCLVELTERIRERDSVLEAHIFTQATMLADEFAKYSRLYADALAVGTFPYAAKGAVSFFESLENIIPDLVQNKLFDRKNHTRAFQLVMCFPFKRMAEYAVWLNKVIACLPSDCQETAELKRAVRCWESLQVSSSADHNTASKTQAFWEGVSPKISDPLRLPGRRLLRESKTHPLMLHSAGRFSSHLFLLFSDVFVHVQSTNTLIFPLETVWVEAGGNAEGEMPTILITSPEDILLVTASTPAEKAEWLMALNSAINKVLQGGQPASRHSGGERLTPRVVRHASHTFVRPGPFHSATYTGSWASGKVHGYGEMVWSDGRKYVGNFSHGLQEGEGVYTEPKGEGQAEVHQGSWKDGKLCGFASIKYASGDSFQGYFKDGQRFGHGVLRQGRHTASSASVYVGEWLHDRRHGYGVHDDVLKGEKYMGQWLDDMRSGQGILVTLDGMYFEGHFSSNRMSGQGLMLTDDNCCYEGEFQGITQLHGRGTLTLSNGDKIEGTFSGSLDDGVKITGTFLKAPVPSSPEKKGAACKPKAKYFGKLSVPAERKWEDLFRHCCSRLGFQGGKPDCEKAWHQVAAAVSAGRRGLQELRARSPNKARQTAAGLEGLETIPPHNVTPLTTQQYSNILKYLAKAFELNCHPLGELMDSLVDVFRATYVGVGAHPRLLSHAVNEVQSYVLRLFAVIRILFPELPEKTGAVQIFPSETDPPSHSQSPLQSAFPQGMDTQDGGIVISASGLLSPILLPKLYPPLFDLYALHFDPEDDRYWERVVKLNRQGDMALMAFLGVPQKYWLMDEMLKHCQSENLSLLRDQCYASAVDKLQHISSALSPMEKMVVVEGAFLEITVTVQGSLGEQHTWCMDDLFPIFQFVVVRAKIRHLGAEVALVEDLMEKHLEHGELGLMVTTLKACYYQILNEKMPN